MMFYLNFLMNSLLMMLMVLISIAFLTLYERKVLGYIQIRKGPNKVGFMGLFQPFSDAIKLFNKEMLMIIKSNYYFFLISPMFAMLLMLMLWNFMPTMVNNMNNKFNLLMIFCLLSMGVYSLIVAGWSSNSIYSLIGGMRSIAQTISYEVSMVFLMICLFIYIESFNMEFFKIKFWLFLNNLPIMIILYISFLAELNRTPFDLAEGESELVSGFNTEYSSGSFALIFIAEYGMIMLMMYLYSLMFFGGQFKYLSFYFIYINMLTLILWIRGSFPRYRYDNLMMISWKKFLPVSLNYLMFLLMMKFFFSL